MIMKQQLEIKLESAKPCRRTYPGNQRRARARWWFDQMRAVVDRAPDWPVAPMVASAAKPSTEPH